MLGDDSAGDYIKAELPSQTRIVNSVPIYQATFQKVFSGENRLNTFSWTVERVHASTSVAAAFKWGHGEAVPLIGLIEIIQEKTSRWLKSAVIPEVRCIYHNGTTTLYTYTALGGAFLTKNPNL